MDSEPGYQQEKTAVGPVQTDLSRRKDENSQMGEMDDDSHEAPGLPTGRFMLLGLGLASGLFLSLLDNTIVATCLFAIAVDFDSIENINWVALAYTLSYMGCAVLYARLSDVIGRKATFLASYLIFIAFSLGCAWAQSLNQLIAFRALQGIGGSDSTTMIIFPEVASPSQTKFVSSMVGLVIALAGVLGPVLGGVFTHYASWRWVFWFNGPVGGLSALFFIFTWPDKKYLPKLERRRWQDVDYLGSVLLVAGAVPFVYAFQNAAVGEPQWSHAVFIAPLLLGIFALFLLGAWELFIDKRWKRIAPAIPLDLLRNPAYTCTVLNILFMGFPYFLTLYVFPIRFQIVNNKSALDAGLMVLPLLGGSAIGTFTAGALNGKKNRAFETLLVAGFLMILGCGLATMSSSDASVDKTTLGVMVFMGLGYGMCGTVSVMLGLLESTIHEHASAQAIISQARIMGGCIGIAASSAILGVKTRAELVGVLDPAQLADLEHHELTPEQFTAVRVTYTDAFRVDMIVCCAMTAAAMLAVCGMYRKNRMSIEERMNQRQLQERARVEAKKSTVSGDEHA